MSFDKEIILGYAKLKVKKMTYNQKFIVSDILHDCEEYKKLSRVDKQTIGKLFKNEVSNNNFYGVTITGNKKNNCIEYIKNKN